MHCLLQQPHLPIMGERILQQGRKVHRQGPLPIRCSGIAVRGRRRGVGSEGQSDVPHRGGGEFGGGRELAEGERWGVQGGGGGGGAEVGGRLEGVEADDLLCIVVWLWFGDWSEGVTCSFFPGGGGGLYEGEPCTCLLVQPQFKGATMGRWLEPVMVSHTQTCTHRHTNLPLPYPHKHTFLFNRSSKAAETGRWSEPVIVSQSS